MVELQPLTFTELKEMAKMCDDNSPCLYDIELIGKISRITLKERRGKKYYSVTIRQLDNSSEYFIVHINDINIKLKEGDVIYVRGVLFKFNDFVFLNTTTVQKV